MITHEGFNLDSPNLHQICILHRPRLGLLMGDLDLHLQGRSVHFHSNLSKIRLVRMITHEGFMLDSPKLHKIYILNRPPLGLLMGDLDLHLQGRLVHFRSNLSKMRLVRKVTHEGFNLDSPNLHQICILYRPCLGLLMVDLDVHLQGRSVHFRSNLNKIRLVRTISQ